LEPPLRSRRRAILSVRLAGLVMINALVVEGLAVVPRGASLDTTR
jgi:hypothetical protein